MWHVNCDTWHETCDMWHMMRENILSNVSSSAHTIWARQCLQDSEQKDDSNEWYEWINQLISYGGDCRTAPASPGLLMTTMGAHQGSLWPPKYKEKYIYIFS